MYVIKSMYASLYVIKSMYASMYVIKSMYASMYVIKSMCASMYVIKSMYASMYVIKSIGQVHTFLLIHLFLNIYTKILFIIRDAINGSNQYIVGNPDLINGLCRVQLKRKT